MHGFALILMLAFAQNGAPSSDGALELLKTRHIAVPVKINGKGPVRLVFDTGSPITFVRAGAAQQIGLISEKTAKGFSLGGLRTMVQAKTVESAGAEAKDLNVVIMDHPTVDLIGQFTGGLDGILGFSFFARFRTVIDYAAGTISFEPNGYSPEEVFGGIMRRVFLGVPDEKVLAPPALWGVRIDNAPGGGVLITGVHDGSAAESAGLKKGDIITSLDDRWTDSVHELYQAASGVPAGESASVKVKRGSETLEIAITPRKGI